MAKEDNTFIIGVDLDGTPLKKSFSNIESAAQTSGQKMGRSFRSGIKSQLGKAFSTLKTQIIGLGAAFAAAFAGRKLIGQLKGFQLSIVEINTIAEKLGKTNEELEQTFIGLAKQFGTSAQDQAKSFYQIISAGVTDASKANKLLVASNKLAIGGLTNNVLAVDVLTSSVNAFASQGLTAARAADVLFGTVKLGKVRVEDLASSLGLVLTSANQVGLTFEETNAAVAQLTTKGLSASIAVTQLNAVLTGILKKADVAKQLGVSEEFSLLSLRTKGLVKFLKDLDGALGGSETKLTKLLGRVEGSKAIMSLASDGFEGLDAKVKELEESIGAADKAFQLINRTIDQQGKILFSQFSLLILDLSLGFKDGLTEALITFNENFDEIIINMKAFIITLGLAAAFVARGAIFGILAAGLLKMRIALKLFRLDFLINFNASLILGETGLAAFSRALSATQVFVKGFALSIKILKGVMSFGLLIAVDVLIVKFITLNEETKSLGDTFVVIGEKIKIAILGSFRTILNTLRVEAPAVLDALGINFVSASITIIDAITAAELKIDTLTGKIINLKKVVAAPILPPELPEQTVQDLLTVGGAMGEFTAGVREQLNDLVKDSRKAFKQMGKDSVNILGKGVGAGFAAVGKAIANGENAVQAFLGAILNTFAQVAIQLGTQFILTGIAYSFSAMPALMAQAPGLIAAGAALATFGGVLSAVGGGGGGSSSGGGGGISEASAPELVAPAEAEEIQSQTQVQVNVTGDIFDTRETGLRIVELINDNFDTEGTVIATA